MLLLQRYDLSVTVFEEPSTALPADELQSPVRSLLDLDRKADVLRKYKELQDARESFTPEYSSGSHLPLSKVRSIHDVVGTVKTNLSWKDPRVNRYQALDEVLARMTGEFRGRNLTNTDKYTMMHTTYLFKDPRQAVS